MKRIIVLSGQWGSGVSFIADSLLRIGYRVVSGAPSAAMDGIVTAALEADEDYVLWIPITEIFPIIFELKKREDVEMYFLLLTASLEARIARHRLNRHLHPAQAKGLSLEEALAKDDKYMEDAIPFADCILDGSGLDKNRLWEDVLHILDAKEDMKVSIISAGLRYGVPRDADVILDCRNAPNPYWDESLRPLTGLDQPIIHYLETHNGTEEVFDSMHDYLTVFLEGCRKTRRRYVSVYICCTGGQHRSVYFATRLFEAFKDQYPCELHHREKERWGSHGA